MSKFYKHVCKHYHLYSFIANSLIAVSMAGLALLGILTNAMTVAWLIGWGFFFAVMFGVGKLLDQEIEDMGKVKDHKCEDTICSTER
ncbi:hypothetical protein PMW_151 [Pseudomonas phage phiPMW]|uniref:Uncharacterized protein n=1 Tax=Pseudomonas phage phiPMW TaxID=1815582 RepID=A0A1S5R1K5_9CAUD|nr:hypothetical protein FDG97_gp199 [Pseudomonas phage phiPMW]ANA49276.1 hypothetical protein PMW_151 [Pseudomonas phage phiPMW]